MSIVLSNLQVIGYILLAVVIIALIIILAILFCPFRYLVEGDMQESKWAKVKAHWILHLFRIRVSYEDDLIYGEIGMFWKKKTFSRDLTAGKDEEEDVLEENENEETIEESKEEDGTSKKKRRSLKEIYPKIKKVITDEQNKKAVAHLKKEFVYLLKVLLPKKSKLDASFSAGSPDITGQLFGVLACFPIFYHDGWKLYPDFASDEAYFKGYFWGKGTIYGFQLVGIVLRIIFDKNCTRLYTIVKRLLHYIKQEPNQEEK